METDRYDTTKTCTKLVIVGDSMCGKRTLSLAFEKKEFFPEYSVSTFDVPVIPIEIHRKIIHMALIHTHASENYDCLRPLLYPDANVALICFSVDSPTSVKNVTEKWLPEIRLHCGQCALILVACKIDLRKDPQTIDKLEQIGEKIITTEMGKSLAAKINADLYMECSAKTYKGVQDLLIQAARLSIKKYSDHPGNRKCILQ